MKILRANSLAIAAISILLAGSSLSNAEAADIKPPAPNADWLETTNYYRMASDLAPIKADPELMANAQAHAYYLANTPAEFFTGSYVSAHTENPASPAYSAAGAKSASNVTTGMFTYQSEAIDSWMIAPFHTMGFLRENLEKSGFGFAKGTADNYTHSTFEVLGLNNSIKQSKTILFPGNGSYIRLNKFTGENPDPREGCGSDWKNFSGLPIFASFINPIQKGNSGALTLPDNSVLSAASDICLVDQYTFKTSDSIYGPAGRSIIAGDNMIMLIPKNPLAPGKYGVSITQANGNITKWNFNVIGIPEATAINNNFAEDRIDWKASEPALDNPVVGYELVLTSTKDKQVSNYKANGIETYISTANIPDGTYWGCLKVNAAYTTSSCKLLYWIDIKHGWRVVNTQIKFGSNPRITFDQQPLRGKVGGTEPEVKVLIKTASGQVVREDTLPGSSREYDIKYLGDGKKYVACLYSVTQSASDCMQWNFNYTYTPPTPAKPTPAKIAGTVCSKLNSTKTVDGKKYRCTKSGSKLLWK